MRDEMMRVCKESSEKREGIGGRRGGLAGRGREEERKKKNTLAKTQKTPTLSHLSSHTSRAGLGASPSGLCRPLHSLSFPLVLVNTMLRTPRFAALRAPRMPQPRRHAPPPLPRPSRRLPLLPPCSSPPSDAVPAAASSSPANADAPPGDADAFTRAWMRALLLCWFAAQVRV